jgi:hypothetical protein
MMAANLSDEEAEGLRRAERRPLDESARLRPNSWSSLEIQVLDLSELGFRGACEARLRSGGCVTLEVPGIGPVDAQVEWQRKDEFGARFILPVDLAAVGWNLSQRRETLAQLLVQRAAAASAGRRGADAQMRGRILAALPIRKIG